MVGGKEGVFLLFLIKRATLRTFGYVFVDLIEVGVVAIFADDEFVFDDDDFLFTGEKVVITPNS